MVKSTTRPMQWASALSTRPFLEAAVAEVVEQAQASLQATADLGIVFIASSFTSEFPRLMPLLREKLPGVPLVGASGGGVIGMTNRGKAREVEEEPSLSLVLATLPGVKVTTFHLNAEDFPDLDSAPTAWETLMGVPSADQPHFVIFADSFSAKINDLLQGLDFAYPGAAKVGGLASAGTGNNSGLFCDRHWHREGTVGVALSGNIVLETIVAQGCRPIGRPYWVAEGERNIMLSLREAINLDPVSVGNRSSTTAERTPLEILRGLVQDLSDADRELAETALFVGIAQNEFKQDLEPGDFLIRHLLGVDPRMGAIAIGDRIRPGQRIQFHLRDADKSAEDLEVLLQRYQLQVAAQPAPVGALMFACMGRGEGLYGEPNFDSYLFNRYFPIPIGGFFCNGEIGPVGNSTFLHGYTSVFGILREKESVHPINR
jgi:small ligand-binding sensory domain FIST